MVHSERARSRIQTLEDRLARLRAEKQRLIARASQAERKRDTRRKIRIGGAVLAAVQHEGVPAMRSVDDLLRWLDAQLTRAHDRAAFDLSSDDQGEKKRIRPYEPTARSEAAVKDVEHREPPRSGAQRPWRPRERRA